MKEIGGYFGLETLKSNEYYKDLIPLNSGRNALLYLMKAKNIEKIYIPYYLCDSVSDMLDRNGYSFEYYKIDYSFRPSFNKSLDQNEYLYIVNYYGQLTNNDIAVLAENYGQVVIDNTQSFFQQPLEGIDTIYSCRKFFGVPDGAYLSTNTKVIEDLSVDISFNRMTHLLGRFEENASRYYDSFKDTDEKFKNEPLKAMSKLTHNILGAIDYGRVINVRNENYSYLDNHLKAKNKLNIKPPNAPFSYPFYIDSDVEIRKKLAEKKIYLPTLWPNVLEDKNKESIEYKYTANILPLPCDQRYGINDMKKIISEVLSYILRKTKTGHLSI